MPLRTRIILAFWVILSFLAISAYAANGDLNVQGNLSVGSGIKFPDNSTQTSAAPGNALVWDYTVTGTPVSSVASPPLDGNVDGGYELEFYIVNNSGGRSYYNLYYNNDQVKANYTGDEIYWTGGVIIGTVQASDAYLMHYWLSDTDRVFGHGFVQISPEGYVSTQIQAYRFGGYLEIVGHRKKTSIANLTRLDIAAIGTNGGVVNGIGVNSRFRLWKKK